MENCGYVINTSLSAEKHKWLIICHWPKFFEKTCCSYGSEELVAFQDRGRSYHQKNFKIIGLVKIIFLKESVFR